MSTYLTMSQFFDVMAKSVALMSDEKEIVRFIHRTVRGECDQISIAIKKNNYFTEHLIFFQLAHCKLYTHSVQHVFLAKVCWKSTSKQHLLDVGNGQFL